ncbi:hypothetical protein DEO72_LG11g1833 [Vigna unguiculata]|uniref:Uncharacterized protein n=1 Tax=Vigna unguiculata TaxID=3917 RepID=A0A4D6NST9_VIGUN|nr:hypothetical protein DEO72_LG11g1833 [Vigna unguiculata]
MSKKLFDNFSLFAINNGITIPMKSIDTTSNFESTQQSTKQTDIETITSEIHSPRCVKRKGRPRSMRKQSRCEKGPRTKRSSNRKEGVSFQNSVTLTTSIILPPNVSIPPTPRLSVNHDADINIPI